jgi:sigma-B regulation protein RsbU (phosphoserine phosphatase)
MLVWIHDQAKWVGFDSKTIKKIELASEEAIVNVINHAYEPLKGNIEIAIRSIPKMSLEIEIKDQGFPFNPLQDADLADLESSLEKREVGGLGIHFIRQCMDEVSYKRTAGSNILTLIKKYKTQN